MCAEPGNAIGMSQILTATENSWLPNLCVSNGTKLPSGHRYGKHKLRLAMRPLDGKAYGISDICLKRLEHTAGTDHNHSDAWSGSLLSTYL